MRCTFKRYFIFLFVVFILIVTWDTFFKENDYDKYTQTCNIPGKYQEELHSFTNKVHKVLQKLNLTHFLCYGSLWGEIRLSRLLPWEDKSIMCLLNEEISAKDELIIVRMFKKHGFSLSYVGSEGQYIVTKLNDEGRMRVILILFELDKVVQMYRRIGWMRRVLPPDCDSMESLDCFPPRLIFSPLPIKEFGGYLIPVPREGIELQKYHYRNNWWEEVPLKNC